MESRGRSRSFGPQMGGIHKSRHSIQHALSSSLPELINHRTTGGHGAGGGELLDSLARQDVGPSALMFDLGIRFPFDNLINCETRLFQIFANFPRREE